MSEKGQYYYCFRDTLQDNTLLRDIYVKISRFHEEILTYDKLPKAARKDLKIEDLLGVLYVFHIRKLHPIMFIRILGFFIKRLFSIKIMPSLKKGLM